MRPPNPTSKPLATSSTLSGEKGAVARSAAPPPFVPLDMVPSDSQARRRSPLRALLVLFVLLGLIGAAALIATALRRRDAITTPLASAAAPVVASPSASTAAAPAPPPLQPVATPLASSTTPPAPVAAGTTGTLVFPKSAVGHRRFIDGRVNESHGPTLELPCGPHEVRIGSRGTPQVVEVPCGGEVHAK